MGFMAILLSYLYSDCDKVRKLGILAALAISIAGLILTKGMARAYFLVALLACFAFAVVAYLYLPDKYYDILKGETSAAKTPAQGALGLLEGLDADVSGALEGLDSDA